MSRLADWIIVFILAIMLIAELAFVILAAMRFVEAL